ncbi:hypothetical protein K2F43_11205 [Clostridium estertheticum]|uniref:hypothetical protein n=1 Tax=Clostridium estertheticum TaxID=238834 RepID=UPI001C6E83A0|nr:hypothetical protein [Clostridium estertheticum]MBW9171776.1 hypothetical protein [Clostridium estertheticum]WLC75948.1 hypothetical protein KTC99_03720 [Clostridium estertheticum]
MGKSKKEMYVDEPEFDISEVQESTVEEYDMKLDNMKDEVKKLKKIRRRQKKLNELEFQHKEILRKMDKSCKKNK